MADNKTFKLDNVITQNVPQLFGTRKPQLYLPGMEPFGPFDLWAMLGCFSLLDAKKPARPVTITLTEFLEVLDFARTISEALGHYATFASGDYAMLKESLHRLFTVEVTFTGEYHTKTGRPGRPQKRLHEVHTRVLASYAYIYPAGVTPPDQLSEAKRRNVNKAKTLSNEPGPPIYEFANGPRPESIQFRISEELLRGLTGQIPNIGATVFPLKIFELRRKIPPRDATTIKLLLWVCRQTKQSPRIGLDKLCRGLSLFDPKGRNVDRTRESAIKSLDRLQSFGVIEGYAHDSKTDIVTIKKAEDWHFPANREAELEEKQGD